MDYKIVLDSCGELTYKMKESGIYHTAVLSMLVDGDTILDDESFDRKDFLKRVAVSPECPKSSCPSPDAYMELYGGAEKRVYVVTLSAELSGSYNSAQLGKELWKEENEDGDKQIYVFNSRSASVGESLIALKIQECEEKGYSFEEVIEHVEAYIEEQHTYFVLENLDTLRKNGRWGQLRRERFVSLVRREELRKRLRRWQSILWQMAKIQRIKCWRSLTATARKEQER